MSQKLIRVELTYDDGEREWLEGDDAQAWMECANGIIRTAALRGGATMPKLDWKIEKGPAPCP